MSYYITMEDIANFYRMNENPFVSEKMLTELRKGAGAITTGDGLQFFNPKYGMIAWKQLNLEHNIFGVLPKSRYPRSGFRVIKGMDGSYTDIAIGESGSLPTETKPDFGTVRVAPKQVADKFKISDIMVAEAEVTDDDIGINPDMFKKIKAEMFAKKVDQMLGRKALGSLADGTDSLDPTDATEQLMFTPLDRIVSNKAESEAVTASATTPSSTLANVYDIDRSAVDWADAYVDMSVGSPRALTGDMIRNAWIQSVKTGAQPDLILTSPDTYGKIIGLAEENMMFLPMSETTIQVDVNGIKTDNGINYGMRVATVYGIPIVSTVNVPDDGTGTIGRIYMLDTKDKSGSGLPNLGFAMMRPVEYWELNNPIVLNEFAHVGVYRLAGELIARRLRGQAKIRDIM